MSANNDGGIDEPAFPRNYLASGHNGMTLRDYFAGQALIGWRDAEGTTYQTDAKHAYHMADAMLEARKTGGAA